MRPYALALPLALSTLALGAAPTRTVARTVPLTPSGSVSIDTYKGSVKVTAGDAAEVKVAARIEADGDCGDPAKAVEATDVVVEAGSGTVKIRSDYSRFKEGTSWFGTCSSRPFVHYEISLPRTASLRLEDYKSDSTIDGLAADLRVKTYKGEVRIGHHDGGLSVETYKGDVRADLVRVPGDVKGETYKGTIVVSVPRDAKLTASLSTDRGEADARPLGLTTQARGRRGERVEGTVNGGGSHVRLETYKGSVRLTSR